MLAVAISFPMVLCTGDGCQVLQGVEAAAATVSGLTAAPVRPAGINGTSATPMARHHSGRRLDQRLLSLPGMSGGASSCVREVNLSREVL